MDGLLVDTEPLWYQAECAVMARLGGDWRPADQQALVGGSLDHSVRYLLRRARRQASPAQVGRWLTGTMIELVATRPVPLLPGAAELLAQVARAGLPHALVTGSQRSVMAAVLQRTGTHFPVTVCREDVRRPKPDPEPYRLAAARLGAEPGRCVALEDSPAGVAAAEAAGCRAVAVPSLAPVPPRPGRLVVSSLAELDLGRLRAAVAAPPRFPAGHSGPAPMRR